MSVLRKLSPARLRLPSLTRRAAPYARLPHTLILALLAITPTLHAQINPAPILPHHYIVVYRNSTVPGDAETRIHAAGARLIQRSERFGIASVQSSSLESDAETMRRLAAQPNVDYVVHDRMVTASHLQTRPIPHPTFSVIVNAAQPYDTFYTTSPQGWAVRQVGGYGNNVPGGPASGPWDTTMGKGVRIAIIDSGVDATHPEIGRAHV